MGYLAGSELMSYVSLVHILSAQKFACAIAMYGVGCIWWPFWPVFVCLPLRVGVSQL